MGKLEKIDTILESDCEELEDIYVKDVTPDHILQGKSKPKGRWPKKEPEPIDYKQPPQPIKSKEEMINEEYQELKGQLKDVGHDRIRLADNLIRRAAFLLVLMKELEETIQLNSTVELFKNGSQEMLREHPAFKNYTSSLKSYHDVMKTLIGMLPKEQAATKGSELVNFLNKGNIKAIK